MLVKQLYVVFSFCLVIFVYFELVGVDVHRSRQNLTKNDNNQSDQLLYVTCQTIPFINAGIGNQLFIYASMYGIAQSLRRTPLIVVRNSGRQLTNDVLRRFAHIKRIFPQIDAATVALQMRSVSFGELNAVYDNPARLLNMTEKYLVLTGKYFQSWRYFDRLRAAIRDRLFAFDADDVAEARQMAQCMLSNDTAKEFTHRRQQHTLCVHIRRGNFLNIAKVIRHSTLLFSLHATVFVVNRLRTLVGTPPATIVVIGNDSRWIQMFVEQRLQPMFNNSIVHHRRMPTRPTIDLAFASRYCNSILITALPSTFGWWLAYLSNAQYVFYNRAYFADNADESKRAQVNLDDYVPPSFIPLYTTMREDNTVIVSDVKQSTVINPRHI